MRQRHVADHLRRCNRVGDDDQLVPRHQVVTLGGNPLPIRVAIEALGASHVALLTTAQIPEASRSALRQQLLARGVQVIREFVIGDASSGAQTASTLREADAWLEGEGAAGCVGLHYTGGSKVMAAHARLAWSLRYESRDSGPISHRCTYLNADGELVFDGLEKQQWLPVNDVRVALDELAALHGATLTPEKQPTDGKRALAARIGELVLAGDGHAGLRRWHATLPPVHGLSIEAKLVPSEAPARLGLELQWARDKDAAEAGHTYDVDQTAGRRFVADVPSLDQANFGAQGLFGGSSVEAAATLLGAGCLESGFGMLRAAFDGDLPPISNKKAHRFWRWLCSDWFETWVDSMIGEKLGAETERLANVRIGTTVLQGNQRPELDVLAGVGFRTLCVSVTVASDPARIRHKAFEALTRAATLAGDHGRYLVVCLADKDEVLQRVADDIASHWEGPDTFRVIGLPHLRGQSAPTSSRRRAGNSPRQTLDELFTEWFPGVAR